jgi:hypothetical protein
MAETKPANVVAPCNGLCGQNGWTLKTWIRAGGMFAASVLFMMQVHAYLDHGNQASKTDIDAIFRAIESMQRDIKLMQKVMMSKSNDSRGSTTRAFTRLQFE